VIAVLATLAAAALLLTLGGYDAGAALGALVRGAAGSPRTFVSVTLVRSVPLLLTGLAVALAFRAGVWNIGAEGQLYAGAVAATVVGLAGGDAPAAVLLPAVVLAALVAGAAWAAIPALMRIRLGVGEVVPTILLNFVAIDLAAWLVHGPLQESRGVFPQSDPIAVGARLPVVAEGVRLHHGFTLALGAALLLWLVLRRTRGGFMVRAVGASPAAAEVAGRMPSRGVLWAVFLASGGLAGLAGGVEVSGVTHALYEGLSPGHGYTAIAVALLAGLHPVGVVLTALFFGALEGGAGAMQREAGIPAAWVRGIEALVILSVLAVDRGVRRAGGEAHDA
jgi:simple sugar transport system permease protein